MKIIFRIFIIASVLTLFPQVVNSQSTPPPPPPAHGNSGNSPPGGGAPLGAGAGFLLLMAAGYGLKRVYDLRQKLEE